ncbi:hypothetical protein L207DRAFT_518318 [Hyaloscypha variabilis F]|uniref:Uncharacterized protein n=1 Tax=Hyaloscypha variabilis (strain UAMH 11265 / GT02V1 / F) TaxID=1149755 RepID=A0A2J6R353_HYAVF|nr:hypothetical protein L207DRAFT_518318 [Hyaloscypha variabilis F]
MGIQNTNSPKTTIHVGADLQSLCQKGNEEHWVFPGGGRGAALERISEAPHSGCCQLIRHHHRIPALLSFTFSSSMFRFHPASILPPQLAARVRFKRMKSSIQQRVVMVGEVKADEEDMACTDPPTLLKLDVLLRDTVAEGLREGGGFNIQLLRWGVCLHSFRWG